MAFNQQGELPPTAAPGQAYGDAGAQLEAQQQVPMAPPPQGGEQGGMGMPGAPMPGELGGFDGPTERPGEPVTAGIGLGDGPGPETLNLTPYRRGVDLLRRAAQDTMDPFLLSLVERLED